MFEESPAMTAFDLGKPCAASIFMFAPPGRRFVHLSGTDAPSFINVTEGTAKALASQLRAMRAAGRQPFVDLNHKGMKAGNLLHVFWRHQSGIMGLVDWLPEIDEAIIKQTITNFSPQWVAADGEIVGVGLNAGAALTLDVEPGYGKHLCRLVPSTRRKELNELADLFISLMGSRGDELRASGDELGLVHARDEMRDQFPKLFKAYSLRKALKSELGYDFNLRTA